MLYRKLLAMEVEERIGSHPLDTVVLLGSCDKTTSALLMGAISAKVPAIVLPGGPATRPVLRTRGRVGSGLWYSTDEFRAGRMRPSTR